MPALIPTDFYGEVAWLGCVPDRDATLSSEALSEVEIGFEGIAAESRGGLTRPSCSRVISQHPRGTEIRNTRQLCVVSEEEMAQTAAMMGIERLTPDLVGASLMLRGLPDLTFLPPSSRLQGSSGVTLIVDMENRPCHLPAPVIDTAHPGKGAGYKQSAKGRRGVVASVERPGRLALGDQIRLHVPAQRLWAHHEAIPR